MFCFPTCYGIPSFRNIPQNRSMNFHDECMGLFVRWKTTRPHVGCGDVTLDPMDTHGRLDLRGCLTCGCAAYGTVLRPGSRSISHVSIFRFRSAVSAVVTQGCRFVAVSNLLFSCWKKWGGFWETCFSLREIGIFGFSTSKVGYWVDFLKILPPVTVDFSDRTWGPR